MTNFKIVCLHVTEDPGTGSTVLLNSATVRLSGKFTLLIDMYFADALHNTDGEL